MKATHLLVSLAITAVLAGSVAAAGRNANRGQGPCTQPATTQLTEAEIADVVFMREEEKLARDVYLTLAESWDCPIFTNIAAAEQRHMDAVGLLIVKHDLDDPIVDDTPGVFATPEILICDFTMGTPNRFRELHEADASESTKESLFLLPV